MFDNQKKIQKYDNFQCNNFLKKGLFQFHTNNNENMVMGLK